MASPESIASEKAVIRDLHETKSSTTPSVFEMSKNHTNSNGISSTTTTTPLKRSASDQTIPEANANVNPAKRSRSNESESESDPDNKHKVQTNQFKMPSSYAPQHNQHIQHNSNNTNQHREAVSSSIPKIKRGSYVCSRCGESKKGHLCTLKVIHQNPNSIHNLPNTSANNINIISAPRFNEPPPTNHYLSGPGYLQPAPVSSETMRCYIQQHQQQQARLRLLSFLQVLEETKDHLLQQNIQLKLQLQKYEMAHQMHLHQQQQYRMATDQYMRDLLHREGLILHPSHPDSQEDFGSRLREIKIETEDQHPKGQVSIHQNPTPPSSLSSSDGEFGGKEKKKNANHRNVVAI